MKSFNIITLYHVIVMLYIFEILLTRYLEIALIRGH